MSILVEDFSGRSERLRKEHGRAKERIDRCVDTNSYEALWALSQTVLVPASELTTMQLQSESI